MIAFLQMHVIAASSVCRFPQLFFKEIPSGSSVVVPFGGESVAIADPCIGDISRHRLSNGLAGVCSQFIRRKEKEIAL